MSIEGGYRRPDAPEECVDCIFDTDCRHQAKGSLCKTAQAQKEQRCKTEAKSG